MRFRTRRFVDHVREVQHSDDGPAEGLNTYGI